MRSNNYYSVVTDFVTALQEGYSVDGKTFNNTRVTGVSLGGGLAMIVGGQTEIPAVAFAGPNPTLMRKTYEPPVSFENINQLMINVKPDGDFISWMGGDIRNMQHIDCKKYEGAVYTACHSFFKQHCEYAYSCGSETRPVLCTCVERFGFPQPLKKGDTTRTFEQACIEEEDIVRQFMVEEST